MIGTGPVPVVETHVHFWDRSLSEPRWDWLDRPFPHGDLTPVRVARYGPEAFRGESRLAGVTKVVHASAADGPDPVAETAWLQRLSDESGWPNGIVATCDLAAADAAAQLDRHLEFPAVRGFRDMRDPSILGDDGFRRGYARLAGRGLVFCHTVGWRHWELARDLVRGNPDVTFCLDQAGMPDDRSPEIFAAWRGMLTGLAAEPNVVVKISSLGMLDPSWTVASRRPWVLACVEAFGTDRCFFGSNWPIERLYSSYTDVVAAFRESIAELTPGEQAALLGGNVERIFRV